MVGIRAACIQVPTTLRRLADERLIPERLVNDFIVSKFGRVPKQKIADSRIQQQLLQLV